MNSVLKLIRRFFGILVLSLVFGIVLNVGLWIAYISKKPEQHFEWRKRTVEQGGNDICRIAAGRGELCSF